MADVLDEFKAEIEKRIAGLKGGIAHKQQEHAQLSAAVTEADRTIQSTYGMLQEAENMLKIINEKIAARPPEGDYPRLTDKSEELVPPPPGPGDS